MQAATDEIKLSCPHWMVASAVLLGKSSSRSYCALIQFLWSIFFLLYRLPWVAFPIASVSPASLLWNLESSQCKGKAAHANPVRKPKNVHENLKKTSAISVARFDERLDHVDKLFRQEMIAFEWQLQHSHYSHAWRVCWRRSSNKGNKKTLRYSSHFKRTTLTFQSIWLSRGATHIPPRQLTRRKLNVQLHPLASNNLQRLVLRQIVNRNPRKVTAQEITEVQLKIKSCKNHYITQTHHWLRKGRSVERRYRFSHLTCNLSLSTIILTSRPDWNNNPQ